MSSKIGRFFYLLISFILGTFFLLGGLYSFSLPWSTFLQNKTIYLILDHTLIFSLFGLALTLIGLSILVYSIISSRRSYVYIRTGHHAVIVDENLIQQYLETYWREQFPKQTILSHLTIKKNSIQIMADLPALPKNEQSLFLERVRQDFIDIFGRLLGYPHEIYLAANFKSDKE